MRREGLSARTRTTEEKDIESNNLVAVYVSP